MSISDEERSAFTDCDARILSAVGGITDSASEGHAWTRFADAMGRTLYTFDREGPPAPDPGPPADRSPVAAAIELRVRTREIHTAVLGLGEAVRRAFLVLDALLTGGAWQRRPEALIALSLAAGHARGLDDRLVHLSSSMSPRPTALAAALGTALSDTGRALDTTQGLLRELSEPDGSAPPAAISGTAVFAAVAAAVRLATCLEDDVRAEAVDASGVDLSRLDPVDPALLAGVIWSRTTVWPACLAPVLRGRSNRVAAGVYQVRRVYDTRDG
ncbi:hypothetical protein [Embleya sp. NPDC050493]|uniref:hypothetical protein n=1 Tax=Embleya sp. NPDC050493 TaxID=3363989 RepID=UPI0037B792C1